MRPARRARSRRRRADSPFTSFPACPSAVDGGQPGISEYGVSCRCSSVSAKRAETAAQNHADHNSIPAMHADMKFAMVPAATAFIPSLARSDFRVGARRRCRPPESPPSSGSRTRTTHTSRSRTTAGPACCRSCPDPRTPRIHSGSAASPSRFPTVAQSLYFTPSSHAMGANMRPRIACIEPGSQCR